MKALLDPSDYETLFRLDVLKGRVTGMLTDFVITGSLAAGDPLVTFDGSWWSLRVHRQSEELIASKGLDFFRNKDRYEDYANEFRQYIRDVEKNIIPLYVTVPDMIGADDFVLLVKKLRTFWYLYGFTEGVYHDLAHAEMVENDDPVLKANLEDLGKLKFEGRALLNAFILEDGLINNVLKCIAAMFGLDDNIAKYMYPEELENLFAGEKPDMQAVGKRAQSFVVVSLDNVMRRLDYAEAQETAKRFTEFELAEFKRFRTGLRGNVANAGRAVGKVVISPMLDIKAAMEVEKRMEQGDILVVQSTNPDLLALCKKAGAIVTDQGGMLSHAAIISRELGVPCIVGTINGTKVFKDGDIVEVDAENGIIRILN